MTVKDHRGGRTGWSLTGKVTAFTGPRGTIDAGRLTWAPACTTGPGSPSTCTAGSPGAVGENGATLATAPDAELTGGEFTAGADVTLDIPKYTPVGNYTATLTLTLL